MKFLIVKNYLKLTFFEFVNSVLFEKKINNNKI